MNRLADVGVIVEDVGLTLEERGAGGCQQSFTHVLSALDAKARELAGR